MPNYTASTHTFKEVGGLSLSIDVSKPQDVDSKIVLLHFHGGFLVCGEKTTFPPRWLISAAIAREWTYATPSYRLLPEASGLDVLGDALDAIKWVKDNISEKIIIAGSSAGGYLALATAAHPSCPRPLAVLSVSGMLDPASDRYIKPGRPLRAPVADLPDVLEEIDTAMRSGEAIDGYAFPVDRSIDQRFKWIGALHEGARYPDVLTRTPGLAGRIDVEGVKVIPEEYHSLFPIAFGLTSDFPPTVLLHGDADALVEFEQSALVGRKMASLGIEFTLVRAEGQDHAFDAKSDINLDAEDGLGVDATIRDSLRQVIVTLEKVCR